MIRIAVFVLVVISSWSGIVNSEECPYGCTSCDSREKCTSCKEGMGLINDGTRVDCDVCGIYCLNCDGDTNVCQRCRPVGYRKTADGKCEACDLYRCAKCDNSKDKCDECEPGYTFSDGRCTRSAVPMCRDSNCARCPADDPRTCEECKPGYYNVNQCTECSVSACAKCSETGQCAQCQEGYTEDQGICKRNVVAVPVECSQSGCLTCEEGGTKCKSCKQGYYITTTGKCEFCPYGCLSCLSADVCTSCKNGQGLKPKDALTATNEFQCDFCVDLRCQLCSSDASKCTKCKSGYKLDPDGKCTRQSCEQYSCVQCDTDKAVCEECKEGYMLENNKCNRCKAPGCAACPESVEECMTCKDNYLDCTLEVPPAPICRKCIDAYCDSCPSDQAVCTKCMEGYYNTNKCTSCRATVPYCLTCSDDGKCTKCDPLYTVDNGQCTSLQP